MHSDASIQGNRSVRKPRRAVLAGTPPAEAVPRLVDLYAPRIHALAQRLCGRREEAEDLVQDVFLQAFRKWHTFRGDADPGTWLYAIAVRACHARLRKRRAIRRRALALSDLMPWGETTVMELASVPEGDENPTERREAIQRVQEAIARLPEHLRVPVVLKEVLELSLVDTASVLGLAEGTVKTRLHRGRLALRKAMTGRAPAVDAPAPVFEKQVCLDLLKAKMEAMDRGGIPAGFRVPQAEVCARCRAVFREFDLVQEACAELGSGTMSPTLRGRVLNALEAREASQHSTRPRRGRPPTRPAGHSGSRAIARVPRART